VAIDEISSGLCRKVIVSIHIQHFKIVVLLLLEVATEIFAMFPEPPTRVNFYVEKTLWKRSGMIWRRRF